MDLLVDIGNTRIRWCRAEAGLTSQSGAMEYDKAAAAPALREAWAAMPRPDRVIAANVGGTRIMEAVQDVCAALWEVSPVFITAAPKAAGVVNAYSRPGRLGADRWAALIAARRLAGGAACVIDCGTAATIDVIDAKGRHQGGLILPGLAMLRRSLLEGTSELGGAARAPGRRPAGRKPALLAADTGDAIQAGTLYMLIAAVDRICHDVGAELGGTVTRIITGGDAPALLPLLSGQYQHHPDLVLQGLAQIAGEME